MSEEKDKAKQRIKEILSKVDELPTLPNVISKIMKVIENPYSNASHLTEVVSMDHSLTMKTLKLANSAYYGFPREIVTVTEAVVVLGFLTVRNLILTSTLYNMFLNEEQSTGGFDRKKFWRHSVATAICARLITSYIGYSQKDEEEAFTAGLLHDIGKVFLDAFLHEQLMEVRRENRLLKGAEAFFETERRILGIDHSELGAIIIDKWNLPENFIEPIKFHHEPWKAVNNRFMTDVVHVADIVSKYQPVNYDEGELSRMLNQDSLKNLKLDPSAIHSILQSLEHEMSNADLFISS